MASILTTLTAAALSFGVTASVPMPVSMPSLDSPASLDQAEMRTAVERIPVTFGFETPQVDRDALCDSALVSLAIGGAVSVQAAPCLRAYMLDGTAAGLTMSLEPTPEACEALLPSLAMGVPVPLGTGVPCVEVYILTGGEQLAAR